MKVSGDLVLRELGGGRYNGSNSSRWAELPTFTV